MMAKIDKEITIKLGGHLKEVNCIAHLDIPDQSLLLTGGEDTTLKIWDLQTDGLHCLATYRRHTSSIKCLAVSDHKNYDQKILVTAGGRAELRIWLVHGHSCQEIAHHFLKGNDKQRLKTWRDHELIDDTEPAFLSVTIMGDSIFASSSDGVVRKWSFHVNETQKSSLTLCSQSQTLPNAILKIIKLNEVLLSADTGGRLQIFDSSLQLLKTFENIHQNGINSLLHYDNGTIVSGGDDGHVSLTNPDGTGQSKTTLVHSAPITRLIRVPNGFCSVSIDQRITFLGENYDFKSQVFSHCPDISDAVLIEKHNRFIVVGNAMEIFTLNS